jgi:ABC-type branched-subunit amino acid transport system ATPase component
LLHLPSIIRRMADEGVTVILVEHDMRLVMKISDRIHVLANGRTLAEGTPAEVRANPSVVKAYLGTHCCERPRLLSIDNLASAYGRIEALHGISLEVRAGEIVSLVGANGAGKTTLLRAISGVQPTTTGSVRLGGKLIERLPSHQRVALGITQVPEGWQLFAPLSVEDNLKLGAWSRRAEDFTAEIAADLRAVSDARSQEQLACRRAVGRATLAIGRALMAKPRLLLLDAVADTLTPASPRPRRHQVVECGPPPAPGSPRDRELSPRGERTYSSSARNSAAAVGMAARVRLAVYVSTALAGASACRGCASRSARRPAHGP